MHRDKKTGLALAVLLIGIVGALFFRNERQPKPESPKLENPEAIDEQIAEEPIGPYLTDGDSEADSKRDTAAQSVSDSSSQPAWEPPDFLTTQKSADETNQTADNLPPDPVEPVAEAPNDKSRSSPDTSSETGTRNQEDDAGQQKPAQAPQPASSPQKPQIYKVQAGDTLSELAQRFLGSSSRYREIYQANRDILKDPNDLQIGMEIRIPSGDPDRDAQPGGTTSADNNTAEEKQADQAEKTSSSAGKASRAPRFVPAPHSPFSPPPRSRSSSSLEPSWQRVRMLSQVPPKNLPPLNRDAESQAKEESSNSETPARAVPPSAKYTVRRGDSLERIAKRHYGRSDAAQKIYRANRRRIEDRNRLKEGTTLILP